MGIETKTNGSSNGGSETGAGTVTAGTRIGAGGFRSRMEYYMYSGEKKHVLAGMAIIGVIFGVPWYLLSRGTKQMSHQDYLEKAEKADKARNARLSSSPPK